MAIFLYFIYGAALFYFSNFFPYTSLIFFIFLLLLIFVQRHSNTSLKLSHIALAAILCASGFLYVKLLFLPQTDPIELQGSSIELKGVLKSERLSSSTKGSFFIQNIKVIEAFDLKGDRLFIKELRALNEKSLDRGKIYHIKGRFARDGYYLNPGASSSLPGFYVLSATETGEYSSNFLEKTRAELNAFMRESFSDKSSAFLLSIITGERSFLTAEIRNAFSVTGLAHILSISGTHFGLLFIMVFTSFRMLFKYLPYKLLTRLTIYFTPSQIAAVMTAPFLVFYLGISSVSIPSIRAFIMISLFLAGLLFGRKGLWLNTLVIAAFIIILITPDALTDISFQLSFSAVLCIGLITDRLRKEDKDNEVTEGKKEKSFLSNPVAHIFEYIKYSFLISLTATAGTAPLVAYYFHYFPLISPFTNLLLTPLIGFIILPLALLSSLAYLLLGVFPFLSILDNCTFFILDLIEKIAQWRFIDIKVPAFPPILLLTFYTGLLLFTAIEHLRLQDNRRANISLYAVSLSLIILPFFIYAAVKFSESVGLKITFLDVGQGDAAVVELSDNRILVIDTGKSGHQVAEYLRYKGIRNIDALVISHMESDHAGGMEYLLANFNVAEIWGAGSEPYINLPEQKFYFRRLQRGDVVEGSDYKIYILHPYDGFYTNSAKGDENNYSLVMKITGYKNSFLFTGDIEREALEDLVNLKGHLKSNVVKVPHHGSKSSADELFYHLVSPEIAVISAGRKNFHGHPHEETLRTLAIAGVLRTDIDGAVGLQEMPDGRINVKTFSEFRFRGASNWADEVFNIKRLFSVW